MFAIFTQGHDGMNWVGYEETVEQAKLTAEDYRARDGVEFVIVTPLLYFVDSDGARASATE